jgi:hypothetical protein
MRTAALSLVATGAAALTVGLSAGPALAHGDGAHGFGHRGFGNHHALTGTVQSVDTSTNTAVITLGTSHSQSMHRDWDHGSNAPSSSQTVTLDLSDARIFDSAMQSHCHPGSGSSTGASPSSTTLSSVQPGDVVSAVVGVDHGTARQDVENDTAVPVSKLMDWGQPQAAPTPQSKSSSNAHRFKTHA